MYRNVALDSVFGDTEMDNFYTVDCCPVLYSNCKIVPLTSSLHVITNIKKKSFLGFKIVFKITQGVLAEGSSRVLAGEGVNTTCRNLWCPHRKTTNGPTAARPAGQVDSSAGEGSGCRSLHSSSGDRYCWVGQTCFVFWSAESVCCLCSILWKLYQRNL